MSATSSRFAVRVLAVAMLMVPVTMATGCNQPSQGAPPAAGDEPPASVSVAVVKPERTTLRLAVRQPGTVQAYEQTPIFAKVAGYVGSWKVDIGDHVKKGDPLAELRVPELKVEVRQKTALVEQAKAEVTQAEQAAEAADKSFQSAQAKVKEIEAARLRAQAEYKRMKSQSARLTRVGQSVVDREVLDETQYGFEAAEAGLTEVEARIKSAEADAARYKAQWGKALADVAVAREHQAVAEANRDFAQTMLDYTKLTAPYDGVVTRRNVNTEDFVQPATGPRAEPLYVVERRDRMRILVDVPETDASWVNKKAKARVRFQVLKGREFVGEVARISYALDHIARTLVAEIDLDNPKDELRPGMYAIATITGELPGVLSLPASAVVTQGDVMLGYQTFCYLVVDGKAKRTLVELGARGTDRVEVLKKQTKAAKPGEDALWENFTGDEIVIKGNLAGLSDGQAVSVAAGGK